MTIRTPTSIDVVKLPRGYLLKEVGVSITTHLLALTPGTCANWEIFPGKIFSGLRLLDCSINKNRTYSVLQ